MIRSSHERNADSPDGAAAAGPVRGSRSRRRRRRLLRISMLPAMATLANAICGFAAIHFAARPGEILAAGETTNLMIACYLIFVAQFFDAIDGVLARLTRSSSDFGGQLDSLADIVSFGIAPAFIVVRLWMDAQGDAGPTAGDALGRLFWCFAGVYFCCAAIRLARFNVENGPEESKHRYFSGLPSPAAASGVVVLVLLQQSMASGQAEPSGVAYAMLYIIPLCAVAFGLLMVSRVRFLHLATALVRGKQPPSRLVYIAAALVLLVLRPILALTIYVLLYISFPLLRGVWRRALGRTPALAMPPTDEPLADETRPIARSDDGDAR